MVYIGCVALINMECTALAFKLCLSHRIGVEYVRDTTDDVAVRICRYDCFDQLPRGDDESGEDFAVGIIICDADMSNGFVKC